MLKQSDRDLYRAACGGDREAFQRLAERHHAYSLRVAATLIDDDLATAEDVAHKAWLNVCRHLKQVEDGERQPLDLAYDYSFLAWLKRVTTNVAMDEHRRRARLSVDEIHEDDLVYTPDLDQRMILGEQQSVVWEAFRQLGRRCQELLLLLVQDPPLGYQAIADTLGRPIGSIGPTRQRCLEQLRVKL